jgi:hypothetical protein
MLYEAQGHKIYRGWKGHNQRKNKCPIEYNTYLAQGPSTMLHLTRLINVEKVLEVIIKL